MGLGKHQIHKNRSHWDRLKLKLDFWTWFRTVARDPFPLCSGRGWDCKGGDGRLMKPDSREASHLSLANNRQKISDIQGKYINIDSIFTKLNILRQIFIHPIFLIFYWDWGLDWEATACATLEFPPLGTTNAVCLRASELLWKIGLNSRKQILGGFMANPIQLADFWTGTRQAAGRKRFLNVLTKNVWNAGDREMSTSSPKQNVGGLIIIFK